MLGKFSIYSLTILILSLALATGCGSTAATSAKPGPATLTPKTITDIAGRSVTISQTPERIISLSPGNTEILFALGLGDRVVGDTTYCDYPPEAKTKEKIGSFSKIDLEKVASLKPDLILAANTHVKSILPKLEEQGFTVLVLDPEKVAGVFDGVLLVGQATGKEKEAGELVSALKVRYDSILTKVGKQDNKPVVFYEMSSQLHTTNTESFSGDMINLAGGANIAADSKIQYPQLNLETILSKNPQVIILADHGSYGGVTPEQVMKRDGWDRVSAVKSGRIIMIDPNLVSRPGPRIVDGLEEMAKALHPELFG